MPGHRAWGGMELPRDQLIGDLYEAAVRQDGFLDTFQTVTEVLGANVSTCSAGMPCAMHRISPSIRQT